jgi:hypothetical protein
LKYLQDIAVGYIEKKGNAATRTVIGKKESDSVDPTPYAHFLVPAIKSPNHLVAGTYKKV